MNKCFKRFKCVKDSKYFFFIVIKSGFNRRKCLIKKVKFFFINKVGVIIISKIISISINNNNWLRVFK